MSPKQYIKRYKKNALRKSVRLTSFQHLQLQFVLTFYIFLVILLYLSLTAVSGYSYVSLNTAHKPPAKTTVWEI